MRTLVAEDLARWYGQVVGLNDLSVTLDGGVVGLLGPNGAGKSTFLKLVVGELKPSRGSIEVLGEEPFANLDLFRRIGFVPQQDAFWRDMNALEFVKLLTRLGGFDAREARWRAEEALERAGMTGSMKRKIAGYSKGMRQRTKIAQAIAHGPELLVLDEPLTGLDPIGRRELIALFRELGAEGVHVIASSHVLHEVEVLTEDIALLHRGRLLAEGKVADVRRLLNRHPRRVEVDAERARALAQSLVGCDEVVSVALPGGDGRLVVETEDIGAFTARLTELASNERFGIRALDSPDAGLEAVFDYLVS